MVVVRAPRELSPVKAHEALPRTPSPTYAGTVVGLGPSPGAASGLGSRARSPPGGVRREPERPALALTAPAALGPARLRGLRPSRRPLPQAGSPGRLSPPRVAAPESPSPVLAGARGPPVCRPKDFSVRMTISILRGFFFCCM